uniref:Uncharacterized protein n=1 Tax=candidate division CPR3 bacterium TaxID=2268181 RepID=A0A7C4R5L0_UNCC3
MRKIIDLVREFAIQIVLIVVFFIGLLIFIRFVGLVTTLYTFKILAVRINNNYGFPLWISYLLSLFFVCLFFYSFRFSFSFKKKVRKKGAIILIGSYIFFVVVAAFVERDNAYTTSGKPTKCFASTPSGYEYVPCNWRVHPKFGSEVKPVNQEVVASMWRNKNGDWHVERISPNKDTRFFSPDGIPLVWFYQKPDGSIDFFGQPGMHPQLPEIELTPVTKEVVIRILEKSSQSEPTSTNSVSRTVEPNIGSLKELGELLE